MYIKCEQTIVRSSETKLKKVVEQKLVKIWLKS